MNTVFKSEKNVLTIERAFNAELELVWKAWTVAEILDQWWAPKPWKSVTSHMDFRKGGHRIYEMVGPQGEKHVGRTDYHSINVNENFSGEDSFCHDDGTINPNLPSANFKNQFKQESDMTLVIIVTEYASEKHLQQVIEMGMQEGFTMAFENLDEVLNQIN